MSARQFTKRLAAGVISCGVFAMLIWWSQLTGFDARWRGIRPGMTQTNVSKALGRPTWTGKTDVTGAGGEKVTTWRYDRGHSISGRWIYSIDFDYVGPGGAPAVFRTTRVWQERSWPSWWPSPRAKARA